MRPSLPALALIGLAVTTAPADEILDELELAIEKYQAGDVAGSLESVQLSESWLLEKQAGDLSSVFGQLPGWERKPSESAAAGTAFLGGGVTAGCEYHKAQGRIEVTVVGNSPMLAMVSGLVGNAMMASASGSKIVKVHGVRAALKQDGSEWELMVPYHSSVLVTVRANTKKEDAIACAEAIDWDRVEKIFAAR